MNWLLRMFPQFAALEMKCAAQTEHIALLERNAQLSEARTEDMRKVADAAWRSICGRSIFGLNEGPPPLPPDYKLPQPQQGRRMARELVQEQNDTAIRDLLKFYENELEK